MVASNPCHTSFSFKYLSSTSWTTIFLSILSLNSLNIHPPFVIGFLSMPKFNSVAMFAINLKLEINCYVNQGSNLLIDNKRINRLHIWIFIYLSISPIIKWGGVQVAITSIAGHAILVDYARFYNLLFSFEYLACEILWDWLLLSLHLIEVPQKVVELSKNKFSITFASDTCFGRLFITWKGVLLSIFIVPARSMESQITNFAVDLIISIR